MVLIVLNLEMTGILFLPMYIRTLKCIYPQLHMTQVSLKRI